MTKETPTRKQTATTGGGRTSPEDIERILEGCEFPCGRRELVRHARERAAPEDMVRALQEIPNRQYEGADEVVEAFTGHAPAASTGGRKR